MENRTISFPYASFEQGQQDAWKKIGGAAEAFRFMSNGYKQTFWRKGSNEKRQDRIKAALKFMQEHEKKQGGTKAERQLGRKSDDATT